MIDAAIPLVSYTVAGTGPYTLAWPYQDGGISALVLQDEEWTPLNSAQFTISPEVSETTGTLTLIDATAAAYAGARLHIYRATPQEQGFAPRSGTQETALGAQLDQTIMALQEVSAQAARSLRVTGPAVPPAQVLDGHAMIWDDIRGFLPGPDADQIAHAQAFAEAAQAATLAIPARQFPSRAALAAAMAELAPGQVVYVIDIPAIVDLAATGTKSALHDLGTAGIRFAGDVVDLRWWYPRGTTTDCSTAVAALGVYIEAWYGAAGQSGTIVASGVYNQANPIVFGASGTAVKKNLNIDLAGAIFNYIAGGLLEFDGEQCGITFQNISRGHVTLPKILHNHIAGGVLIDNCDKTIFIGGNAYTFTWRGMWVTGARSSPPRENSSGSVILAFTANELAQGEPEFNDDANFISAGLVNESQDVRFVDLNIGSCKYPIDNRAGSVEFVNCHLYNGNPNEGFTRHHAVNFLNNGGGNTNIDIMYSDNGYIVDNSGSLSIRGGLEIITDNSTLTDPLLRIRCDDESENVGVLQGVRVSTGYFKGDHPADGTFNPADDMPLFAIPGFDGGHVWEAFRRLSIYSWGSLQPALEWRHQDTQIDWQFLPKNGDITVSFAGSGMRVFNAAAHVGTVFVDDEFDTGISSDHSSGALWFYADAHLATLQSNGNLIPVGNGTQALGNTGSRWGNAWVNLITLPNGVTVVAGAGSPEGVVPAAKGSLFLRSDGGAGTSMYSKESGAGNTGWVGK